MSWDFRIPVNLFQDKSLAASAGQDPGLKETAPSFYQENFYPFYRGVV